MPPISMTPGTVLAGRYRLDDLLSEQDGARFWRATDTVLARSVAVHVVASSDPRAAAVLEAARRSAGVTESHFLRVLDCADADGLTWVINEWGEGVSLDVMLARGTLPPMRAAWLTREVAEAIAAAHARGEHHGRLNPEAVLVTESGSVKIIGFVVNAAFERTVADTSPYGPIGPREADVVDLAGILYAALTGRWPGVAPSGLPPAPRIGNRPMRPRQVRAGVPRTLDAICDRVLHKEASEHAMPIETAFEVAAALSDYVGDPTTVAPLDLPSMHDEPLPPDPVESEPLDETTPRAPVVEAPSPAPAPDPPVTPLVDPDATMAAGPLADHVALDEIAIEFLEPEEWTPTPPPPPFEQPADRPLFADAERRVPPGAPVLPPPTAAAQPVAAPPPTGPRQDSWIFDDGDPEPGEPDYRSGRRWLRLALVIALVGAIAVAAYLAYTWGRDRNHSGTAGGSSSQTTSPPVAPTTPPTPVLTGAPLKIVGASDFDPEGDPPRENPGQVPLAIDGNPATAWHTLVYRGDPHVGGIKSGVGLVVDLGSDQTVSSVELTLLGAPTELEIRATPPGVSDPPVELVDAPRVLAFTATGTTAEIAINPTIRTRYLLIWLTKLPAVPKGFQGAIAEVAVRG